MRPKRTLVLIANESRARFLLSEGIGRALTEISAIDADDFPDLAPRDAGEAGRGRGGASPFVHTYEPETSERRHRRDGFAAHVARAARQAWEKGFDRFIFAAPPKMLGALRESLPEDMRANAVAELDKDLLKIPQVELAHHFAEHLPL